MTRPFQVNKALRPPRFATVAELDAIRAAWKIAGTFENVDLADLICEDIVIHENYISDGPGFWGTLAWIVHGEPQYNTIFGDNGATGTNWEVLSQASDDNYFCQSCND